MPKNFFVFLVFLLFIFCIANSANAMWWRGVDGMSDIIKGNGNIITKRREIPDSIPYSVKINNVSFISSPAVQIHAFPGDQSAISITTDENILDLLGMRISEGSSEVVISSPKNLSPTGILVEITSPLKEFIGSGEFNFDVTSIGLPTFNLSIDGQANGEINLERIDYTSVNVNGEAILKLAGSSNAFNLNIHGQCSVDAADLISHDCNIYGEGMGKFKVFADSILTIKGSGDWECAYAGNPYKINKFVDGICKTKKIG